MKKSCSNSYAVIGLGFGDEGKGVVTNSLARSLRGPSVVVRYSGGQQAGHTVTHPDGTSHVFANFGSGTMQGTPTYWSEHCTFDPVGVITELEILKKKGFKPVLYVDKNCPVTTPYDKYINQKSKSNLDHGTCGVGVGATKQREENFQSLLAGDLLFDFVLKTKLSLIQSHYGVKVDIEWFLECIRLVLRETDIEFVDNVTTTDNYIFEGSQGLLLDQNIGFFPHVTRSNTGSKNIRDLGFDPYFYLVTRAFQTRHGNGPMTNLELPHNIKDNPFETNKTNQYQGEFKRSLLDLDLLKYGIQRDYLIRETLRKCLVITCMDLVKDEYRYTIGGKIKAHSNPEDFAKAIANHLGIWRVHTIDSPSGGLNDHNDSM